MGKQSENYWCQNFEKSKKWNISKMVRDFCQNFGPLLNLRRPISLTISVALNDNQWVQKNEGYDCYTTSNDWSPGYAVC